MYAGGVSHRTAYIVLTTILKKFVAQSRRNDGFKLGIIGGNGESAVRSQFMWVDLWQSDSKVTSPLYGDAESGLRSGLRGPGQLE